MESNPPRFNAFLRVRACRFRDSPKRPGNSGFQAAWRRYTVRIVPFLPPFLRFRAPGLALLLAAFGGHKAAGQETGVPPLSKLPEIPERFFQVQDDSGFFWQALASGAVCSGETQYLQSGLNLVVDGDPFAPSEAWSREPGSPSGRIELRLLETRPSLELKRELWFDTGRSAVRFLDTFVNRGRSEAKVGVVLRTTYPFAWQSLHGSGGGLLGADSELRLGDRDVSLGVRFNRAEGRHDTLFLVAGERGVMKPALAASANSRELSFVYQLVIPANESRSLLHWVLQRNFPDARGDLAALSPFLQRERLIDAGVPAEMAGTLVNFPVSAFQVETAPPANVRSLIALNGMLEPLGLQRRSEDLLWISATNQISGKVSREGSLRLATATSGERDVALADLAAIRGGFNTGRGALFYLRDGRVFSGRVLEGVVNWTPAGGAGPVSPPLVPEDVNLLLFSTLPSDGTPPEKATHFVQLASGTTHALAAEGPGLDCLTNWGPRTIAWNELRELGRTDSGGALWRLLLGDGSAFAAVFPSDLVAFQTASGDRIEVASSSVRRLWRAGATELGVPSFSRAWFDFSEIPPEVAPEEGFLLAGNEIVAGRFAKATIQFADGNTRVPVEAERIVALRRPLGSTGSSRFEVDLAGGESILAECLQPTIRVETASGVIELPSARLQAYHGKDD